MEWPFIIFGVLLALVLLQVWWRRFHHRRERAKATAEYMTTALSQEREAYAQAQAQLEALFNSMTEGVLVLDREGLVQLYNESFQRLFGLTRYIRGQALTAVSLSRELTALAERLRTEKRILDFEMPLPGAGPKRVQVNAVTIYDQKGQAQGATFIFHDLTRLRQLENTRQEFVANVSHELRTPLSLIKGFVETLLAGAKDDPAVASKFLRNIEKHTNRLTFLIEDLLTISRLESGKVQLNLEEVELGLLTRKVFDDLEARAVEKEVQLENAIPAPFIVRVDVDRMQQVLFNLIENAIKYGRYQGHVTVGGRKLTDNRVEIWVKDDGPGIPPEATERVFERFYRVDRARSRETGGTGLGLAIVKHIVQVHGGEVGVRSKQGEGAIFSVTIPGA